MKRGKYKDSAQRNQDEEASPNANGNEKKANAVQQEK